MYIYQSGAVSEAVRQKIENTKNIIANGAERDSTPFSAVVKSMLQSVDSAADTSDAASAASSASSASALDSSTLLYMLQNSDNSSLSGLLGSYTNAGLKTAAAELQSAARSLLDGGDADKTSAFVDKYNALVKSLTSSGTSNSLVYLNALETYVTASSEQLTAAGISTDSGYTLSYNAENATENADTSQLSPLMSNLATAAMQIYTSASSTSLDGTSGYYQSLIGSML